MNSKQTIDLYLEKLIKNNPDIEKERTKRHGDLNLHTIIRHHPYDYVAKLKIRDTYIMVNAFPNVMYAEDEVNILIECDVQDWLEFNTDKFEYIGMTCKKENQKVQDLLFLIRSNYQWEVTEGSYVKLTEDYALFVEKDDLFAMKFANGMFKQENPNQKNIMQSVDDLIEKIEKLEAEE